MNARQDTWNALERLLGDALCATKASMDQQDYELIADFIDNREFEVAFRWMNSLIKRKAAVPTALTTELMASAASLMKIDENADNS